MRILAYHVATLVLLAGGAAAQLADLQPGRNFIAEANFGTLTAEDADLGDMDNDGDLDVALAHGGDSGPIPNRIHVNQGGAQGGVTGSFVDVSATQLPGAPADTSRDIEFVDLEGDGDLDLFVSNSKNGGAASTGEPSRFWVNLGGPQGGATGFYQEQTNARWGTLLAVPPAQQVFGGNQGPFRDWSCDCDFADLDDDGDLDMLFTSYGPGTNGATTSRVFFNDASGVFHEVWPWANAAADTKLNTWDGDLADFDGDFDIDIVISTYVAQARVWTNNLHGPPATTPFTEVTQAALVATGSTSTSTQNYEVEAGDLDGDSDLDAWMLSYDGALERILRNDGPDGAGGFLFSEQVNWIKGDSNSDEQEVDFLDYDGDGDLDAFVANFSGMEWIYQSSLAQGLDPGTQGLYHRNGATGLAVHPELPAPYPGNTSLDGDAGDVDNDGDEDLVLANLNSQHYLLRNALGVPDVNAPRIPHVEALPAQPDGAAPVVHARVLDNSADYVVQRYAVELVFCVNAGDEQRVAMTAQGGYQFRGVLPPQADAIVTYRVEATDRAGNTGVSSSRSVAFGIPAYQAWTDLGFALPGVSGTPLLAASGNFVPGEPVTLALANAKPSAPCVLWLSVVGAGVAVKGGTLKAWPDVPPSPAWLFVDPLGQVEASATWPGGVPCGTHLYVQFAIPDPAAVEGWALSNCMLAEVP